MIENGDREIKTSVLANSKMQTPWEVRRRGHRWTRLLTFCEAPSLLFTCQVASARGTKCWSCCFPNRWAHCSPQQLPLLRQHSSFGLDLWIFLSLLITTFSDWWSHMWPQQLPGVSPLLRVPSCVTAQFSSSLTPVAQSSPYLPANRKAVHIQLVYSCHRCEMWQSTDHTTSTAPDSWTSSPVSDQWSKPPGSSPSSEDMLKVGCGKPPKDTES